MMPSIGEGRRSTVDVGDPQPEKYQDHLFDHVLAGSPRCGLMLQHADAP